VGQGGGVLDPIIDAIRDGDRNFQSKHATFVDGWVFPSRRLSVDCQEAIPRDLPPLVDDHIIREGHDKHGVTDGPLSWVD